MTTSKAVSEAWDALRTESFEQPGTYTRRLHAASSASIFAAIERPSGLPKFIVDFDVPFTKQASIELRGVSLSIDELENKTTRICLALNQQSYTELFSILVNDCLEKVLKSVSQTEAFDKFLLRIAHWQKFLQVAGSDGLTPQQQQGLFGELLVMKSLMIRDPKARESLDSWKGWDAENQDFFRRGHAIEVKTTSTNDSSVIRISNERQLDDSNLESLVLCHFSLDVRIGSGTSLPILIDEIYSLLDPELQPQFDEQLMQVGYRTEQRRHYTAGYFERSRTYYRVTGDFPRLTPNNLPPEVSRVQYNINLLSCAQYKARESEVLVQFFTGLQ